MQWHQFWPGPNKWNRYGSNLKQVFPEDISSVSYWLQKGNFLLTVTKFLVTDSLQSGILTNAATSSIKRNTLKVMPPGLKVLYLAMNCVSEIGLLTCDSKKNSFYREQSHRAELKQECSLTWVLICTGTHGLNENLHLHIWNTGNAMMMLTHWASLF